MLFGHNGHLGTTARSEANRIKIDQPNRTFGAKESFQLSIMHHRQFCIAQKISTRVARCPLGSGCDSLHGATRNEYYGRISMLSSQYHHRHADTLLTATFDLTKPERQPQNGETKLRPGEAFTGHSEQAW